MYGIKFTWAQEIAYAVSVITSVAWNLFFVHPFYVFLKTISGHYQGYTSDEWENIDRQTRLLLANELRWGLPAKKYYSSGAVAKFAKRMKDRERKQIQKQIKMAQKAGKKGGGQWWGNTQVQVEEDARKHRQRLKKEAIQVVDDNISRQQASSMIASGPKSRINRGKSRINRGFAAIANKNSEVQKPTNTKNSKTNKKKKSERKRSRIGKVKNEKTDFAI
jgi:hypothetical protein